MLAKANSVCGTHFINSLIEKVYIHCACLYNNACTLCVYLGHIGTLCSQKTPSMYTCKQVNAYMALTYTLYVHACACTCNCTCTNIHVQICVQQHLEMNNDVIARVHVNVTCIRTYMCM